MRTPSTISRHNIVSDDAPLTRGDVEGPGPSPLADAYSINEPHVFDLLPLFELETSDPLFDGELSVAPGREQDRALGSLLEMQTPS